MITQAMREQSQLDRIKILREGYGDHHPEVVAWDAEHPREEETAGAADRLTDEEVANATETVPAAGEVDSNAATVRAEPAGKIGGRKPTDDK